MWRSSRTTFRTHAVCCRSTPMRPGLALNASLCSLGILRAPWHEAQLFQNLSCWKPWQPRRARRRAVFHPIDHIGWWQHVWVSQDLLILGRSAQWRHPARISPGIDRTTVVPGTTTGGSLKDTFILARLKVARNDTFSARTGALSLPLARISGEVRGP